MTESNNSSHRVRFGRAALVARLALAATLIPFAAAIAAAAMTLQVETSDTLPGFHRSALPRYLARQMTESLLADWRFEPAANNGSAPDRVEWSFRLNPYARGRRAQLHAPAHGRKDLRRTPSDHDRGAALSNGEYQTLVEKQAVIQGGPEDPDLAAAVASVTQSLLGPQGAFRAAGSGRRPAYGSR